MSPDLRWAHAPVAMWNGEGWYDVHALFTGSATVIDGTPVLMFPGVCDVYPPSGCDYRYCECSFPIEECERLAHGLSLDLK